MATKVLRTITTGYVYDVMKRTGNTLTKIGEVITEKQLRSVKQQKLVLAENHMDVDSVLILARSNETKYEMLESDFIKYSTEVTEIKVEEPKETPAQEEPKA